MTDETEPTHGADEEVGESEFEKQEAARKLLAAIEEKAKRNNQPANSIAEFLPFKTILNDGTPAQRVVRVNPIFLDSQGKVRVATVNLYGVTFDDQGGLFLDGIQEIVILSEEGRAQLEHSSVNPQVDDNFGTLQILDNATSRIWRETPGEIMPSEPTSQVIIMPDTLPTKIH